MSTIETTIKDVLGVLPFTGTDGLDLTSDTRPAARTWLQRLGWKGDVVVNLTMDELRDAYSDVCKHAALAQAKGVQPHGVNPEMQATATYSPRNSNLLAYLARKGVAPAAKPAEMPVNIPGIPPYQPPVIPAAKDNKDRLNKTAQLALLLGELAGEGAPLDEARVIELVKAHAPKPDANVIVHQVVIQNGAASIKIDGAAHPKLALLAQVMGSRMTNGYAPNAWVYGPTASGKTHAVEQIAAGMGRDFYMHGAMSMSHELLGYKDAGGNYHATPFRIAFEKGGICLLDECDSWDPQVTLSLGAALSNGQCAFADGMVKRHPDSVFVAAGNTIGTGPTAEFVGRNRLDAMFLSRFAIKIEWPRDAAIEKAISANDAWVARVVAARDRAAAAGIKHIIDPRHSQAGAALIAAGMDADTVAEITYLAGLQDAQRRTVEGR